MFQRTKGATLVAAARDTEVAALNERISRLNRKPYKEALTRVVTQLLDQMTPEGRHVLQHLMINKPVEVGRTIVPGIPMERQHEQVQTGAMWRREEQRGGMFRSRETNGFVVSWF